MKQKAINKKSKENEKKEYNCDKKNEIREKIIDELRKRDINSILTLESKEFLFSKMLPDKKIIVWENDSDVFKKMEKKTPKNVELIFGNIGKFGVIGKSVDMIYLDFCKTWATEQSEVVRLKDKLKETKLFVLTLCMRTHKKLSEVYCGDYQFDLI